MSQLVFGSSDATRLSAWWSKHRVRLLGRAMDVNYDMLAALKRGKKMTFNATNIGKVDSRLLAVVVAATLSPDRVAKCMSKPHGGARGGGGAGAAGRGHDRERNKEQSTVQRLEIIIKCISCSR